MRDIISIIFVGMLAFVGCSSPVTHSVIETDVTLSSARPTVALHSLTLTLLSIAEDGTTQIKVVETYPVSPIAENGPTFRRGEDIVTARIGESCYGDLLRLKSASSGSATFALRGCVRFP